MNHPDLINSVREPLKKLGRPYVIENVVGSPLFFPVRLCGTMFGLPLWRHRMFECSFPVEQPRCNHGATTVVYGVYGNGGRTDPKKVKRFGRGANKDDAVRAMGIDWMTYSEMAQAIPPTYTEYIGRSYLESLELPSP